MTQNVQHQVHLDSAIEQQKQLLNEIQDLNTQLSTKKEIVLKVQGVIEYLQQVTSTPEETAPEEVVPETKATTKK
jgi:hypothetical protein|tara:strand:- start:747 stop:971 length:225 start_codon:yes stop_codon:yes gene_type:complete